MSEARWERFRTVQRARVLKGGRHAGWLERVPGGVRFWYEPQYVQGGHPPVATTLPTSTAPVMASGGGVPAFFAGLLPEGRRLTALVRAVKTSADDELSLLLAVGRDTIGDVQVVAEGDPAQRAEPAVQVRRDWGEVSFADLLAESGIVDAVGLPGVQPKASARMSSVPVGRAGERYILKVNPPEHRWLVENEAFFLDLAREARLPVARARLVTDREGRPGLLVTRFDRRPVGEGAPLDLACEDACQVLGRVPADKYRVSAEDVVGALSGWCAARLVAVRALFRQVCFAWLTGNGDQHAKNLSILAEPGGEWRVAPAYDLTSTHPYGDHSLALSVQGRTRDLARRHLLEFGQAVGLPLPAARTALDGLLRALDGLAERLRALAPPFDPKVLRDWLRELDYRRRQALGP